MALWDEISENPQAVGRISYGIEGGATGFELDTSGNATFAGIVTAGEFVGPGSGGGGSGVLVARSARVTSGNLAVGSAAFDQLAPDLTVAAEEGDVLEAYFDLFLCDSGGSDLQCEAATRVGGADVTWWSSETGTSLWTGGIGSWYVPSGFTSPRGAVSYVVQAGDISGGTVTVRPYGRCGASTRTVFRNSSFPLRWVLKNLSRAAT